MESQPVGIIGHPDELSHDIPVEDNIKVPVVDNTDVPPHPVVKGPSLHNPPNAPVIEDAKPVVVEKNAPAPVEKVEPIVIEKVEPVIVEKIEPEKNLHQLPGPTIEATVPATQLEEATPITSPHEATTHPNVKGPSLHHKLPKVVKHPQVAPQIAPTVADHEKLAAALDDHLTGIVVPPPPVTEPVTEPVSIHNVAQVLDHLDGTSEEASGDDNDVEGVKNDDVAPEAVVNVSKTFGRFVQIIC